MPHLPHPACVTALLPCCRYEIDLNDPRPYSKQLYDQVGRWWQQQQQHGVLFLRCNTLDVQSHSCSHSWIHLCTEYPCFLDLIYL
jgi:hypothetical protein